MRILHAIPLILLLLSSISFADHVDFVPLVPMTAIVVAIFLTVMIMISTATANPQFSAWAKTELRELITGVVIVSVISALFLSSVGLSRAITGEEDYIGTSISIINDMLSNTEHGYDRAYTDIIRAAAKIRIGASYSPHVTIPIWFFSIMYSTAPLNGINPVFISLGQATQGLTNVIYLYEGIRLLLIFCRATIPTVILPLAFAIRLIPFTRKIGNTLIAVALAGIVLLPFSVILVGEVNNLIDYPEAKLSNDELNDLDAKPWAMEFGAVFCALKPIRFIMSLTDYGFAAVVCLPLLVFPPAYPACYTVVSQVVYPIIMNVIKIVQTVILVAWIIWADFMSASAEGAGSQWVNTIFSVIQPFLENVNNLVLTGYIDIILIAIITISGARSISTALGGEWQLPGLERLI
jgi:hypothetical protein